MVIIIIVIIITLIITNYTIYGSSGLGLGFWIWGGGLRGAGSGFNSLGLGGLRRSQKGFFSAGRIPLFVDEGYRWFR